MVGVVTAPFCRVSGMVTTQTTGNKKEKIIDLKI
jgi:hypothetical protein